MTRVLGRRGAQIAVAAVLGILVAVAAAAAIDRSTEAANAPFAPEQTFVEVNGMELSKVPWLAQPNGSPRIDDVPNYPSIEFPVGVSYQSALDELYRSVAGLGRLPTGVVVRAPLPRGRVMRAATSLEGLRLSLTAPYGWDTVSRTVTPPSFVSSGDLNADEASQAFERAYGRGELIAQGFHSAVPSLKGCQLVDAGAPSRQEDC